MAVLRKSKQSSRETFSISSKIGAAVLSLKVLFMVTVKREITLKQFLLELKMRITPNSKKFGDDFDWSSYHNYYREELKSISRKHSLRLSQGNFEIRNGKIVLKEANCLPLHPNHKLLYETLIMLDSNSVLEVGCGGGDHLANMMLINPNLELFGVDRSEDQLKTLVERHDCLRGHVGVSDLTVLNTSLPSVETVYSQAVLMHISENESRLRNSLINIFTSAINHVVLMENWTQHNFLFEIEEASKVVADWKIHNVYYRESSDNPNIRIMIISKDVIDAEPLTDYEDLLLGHPLVTH